jgi:hypothetical protein
MSLTATILISAVAGLLAAILAAAHKRYPKTKYWYFLAIALVFICLALWTVLDALRYRDAFRWLLALACGGFGVGVAVVNIRRLCRTDG